MARILVIETDARQASLVKAIVLNHVSAQLEIVRSKDQAIAAIDAAVPDLLLLSALISPRDEQEVVAHLRTLDRSDHLQTLTIPRIASSSDDDGSDGGLLRKFRRRRGAKPRAAGCDPKVFAEEILGYLERAEQIKADRAAVAEADRLAAEAGAERLRATSRIQESPAPAAAPIYVAPAAMEMPAVAAPAPDALVAQSPVESPPVVDAASADTPAAETPVAAAEPVAAAPVEPPKATPYAPTPTRTAPLTFWPHPDDTPISAVPWSDQTPVAEDLRALLHGLRLPASLADLARAGGCRIHRVRVAQLPGPATISDRRGDADDLTLDSHAAWLDGRRGTPVASPQPRTPAGSR